MRLPNPTFWVCGSSGRAQCTPFTPEMRATAPLSAASSTTVSPTTFRTPYMLTGLGGVASSAPLCVPSNTQSDEIRIILAPTSLAASVR